jgi:hypothetical protein
MDDMVRINVITLLESVPVSLLCEELQSFAPNYLDKYLPVLD